MPASKTQTTTVSRKAREFERREREILHVALECFSGEDWESVTVAQIANRVGIAKGTMYLHFSSKHEIYARLTLDFYQALLTHLNHSIRAETQDHFRYMVKQAFLFYLERPQYRCVTQYCKRDDFRRNLNAEFAHEFATIDQAFHQLINKALRRGIHSGRYKPVNPEQVIVGLQCTFHGALTMLWCNNNNEQNSPHQFINHITDYMVAPLLAAVDSDHGKPPDTAFQSPHQDAKLTLETTHE